MSKIASVHAYSSTTKEGSSTKFDMDYYLAIHMTMIDKYWAPHGMKCWNVQTFRKEDSLDSSTPPYIVVTTVYWNSVEDLKSALGSPGSKETGADIANFTDVHPVIWVSNVTGENKL